MPSVTILGDTIMTNQSINQSIFISGVSPWNNSNTENNKKVKAKKVKASVTGCDCDNHSVLLVSDVCCPSAPRLCVSLVKVVLK